MTWPLVVALVGVMLGGSAVVAFAVGYRVEERRARRRAAELMWPDVAPPLVSGREFKGYFAGSAFPGAVPSFPVAAPDRPPLHIVHHASIALDPAKDDVERVVQENFLLAQAQFGVEKVWHEFAARGFRVEGFDLEVDEHATTGVLHVRFSKLPKREVKRDG